MFFRIPDEFLIDVKKVDDLEEASSEYRSCLEDEEKVLEHEENRLDYEEDPFEDADEEYIDESIKE